MKRVLLVAAVLAAMLAQPSGAWIAIGQTGQYYQPSGVLVKKDFSYAKTDQGNTGSWWPVFFFDYEAQVNSELAANGFDDLNYAAFHLTMESTTASPWGGWWGLWYGQVPGGNYYLVQAHAWLICSGRICRCPVSGQIHHGWLGQLSSVVGRAQRKSNPSRIGGCFATRAPALEEGTSISTVSVSPIGMCYTRGREGSNGAHFAQMPALQAALL